MKMKSKKKKIGSQKKIIKIKKKILPGKVASVQISSAHFISKLVHLTLGRYKSDVVEHMCWWRRSPERVGAGIFYALSKQILS